MVAGKCNSQHTDTRLAYKTVVFMLFVRTCLCMAVYRPAAQRDSHVELVAYIHIQL